MDRLVPTLVPMLVELTGARGILARNDPKVRLLEGLEQKVEVLHGEVPATVAVREGPVSYDVDPWHGQKTGLFLDQRENRVAAAQYARGRVLDCFSYNGGFALRLASVADEVEALDSSADAGQRSAQNAATNGRHSARVWPPSTPITGIAGCCAPAANGHAAAPPTIVMNSRRLIRSPRRRGQAAAAARRGRSPWRL